MNIIDIIKKNLTISEESKSKYNQIVSTHNDIRNNGISVILKKSLYEKNFGLLKEINKNDFIKLTRKNSIKKYSGFETPFGFVGNIYDFNVDYLLNLYYKEYEKNNVYIENLKAFNDLQSKIEKHKIKTSNLTIVKPKLADINDIKISNITKSFNEDKLLKYVVIDVETTGLKAQSDEIIELTAIKVVDGEPCESFSTLIKPSKKIPIEASKINNITDDMVSEAPIIDSVIEDFDNFIKGCHIVGHNIVFDLKFLFCSGSKILDQKGIKIYDTCELAKKVFKDRDNYRLDDICRENLQIMRDDSHRSLSDALITYYLFCACVELITSNE